MDRGEEFGWQALLRFNGRFFADAEVLPLEPADLAVLHEAARADWQYVEPTIFGTLLTRALDPRERHRLGAEYTPREYVERVVRQTVDVPLRERWAPVQAHAAELAASKRKKDRDAALAELRGFHGWLRGLRFLDPACGSGNFLYVTLLLVKRLELEVLRAIEEITGNPELAVEEVGPAQFHGIEVKPWAREIAELTLWIGYHQFWQEHHKGVNPPQPVLQDTGTLELRDAVLAWDEIVEIPEKSRPDPTPRIPHPVTGKLVPDPNARLPYYEYRGPRQAEWPRADFILGNPPYMGRARQREAFGDGYVDALRSSYPQVPDNGDYVMFWWYRAASAVSMRQTIRAGLITTNTITQRHNRAVIERAAMTGAGIVWAVPDHPWYEEGAAIRVALTVLTYEPPSATLVMVDGEARSIREIEIPQMNSDLTSHADIARASAGRLKSNAGISSQGFTLVGDGFRLSQEQGEALLRLDVRHNSVVRPIVNGRDLSDRPRGIFTIDFGLMTEEDARAYPILFDQVRTHVKPERDANRRATRAKYWWRYGEPTAHLRSALEGLSRYIATVETAKHRIFQFLPVTTAAEHSVVCIATGDAFDLGVLSSAHHRTWALAAGGTLEDRPRYQKALTFDPYPFPEATARLRERIATVAETLDRHRKAALARDERVTMTGMYNVVEKLRSGEKLTEKERAIHEIAACGVLKDLHDELDRLVAEAYGWPWPMEREEILERLVALHDERVEEEKRGIVRWLRPEYQIPRFGGTAASEPTLDLTDEQVEGAAATEQPQPWPSAAVEQLGAVKSRVATIPAVPAEVAAGFAGASLKLVTRHLETLAMVGEVRRLAGGRYAAVTEPF
jgi:hypothetical protein